jgi:hypothetical protein
MSVKCGRPEWKIVRKGCTDVSLAVSCSLYRRKRIQDSKRIALTFGMYGCMSRSIPIIKASYHSPRDPSRIVPRGKLSQDYIRPQIGNQDFVTVAYDLVSMLAVMTRMRQLGGGRR